MLGFMLYVSTVENKNVLSHGSLPGEPGTQSYLEDPLRSKEKHTFQLSRRSRISLANLGLNGRSSLLGY